MLFEPFTIKNKTIRNRIVRSATWEAQADRFGCIYEDTYEIYRKLAKGGSGLIITGFTSVDQNDRYFGGMMRLSDDFLILLNGLPSIEGIIRAICFLNT